MNAALLSAFSALAGSLVGGLTSGFTTWLGYRSQIKAGHRLHHVTQRESLYREFVVSASEAFAASVGQREPRMEDIVALHALVCSMRILSSSAVVDCAVRTVNLILDKYDSPDISFPELRNLIRSGDIIDPLAEFSQIARQELTSNA